MLKKLSTLPLLGFIVLVEPLQAPQPTSPQPPQWYWHGPWHGSPFWWICPLMKLFMFFVLAPYSSLSEDIIGNRRGI